MYPRVVVVEETKREGKEGNRVNNNKNTSHLHSCKNKIKPNTLNTVDQHSMGTKD
jgi:hypothetical protein